MGVQIAHSDKMPAFIPYGENFEFRMLIGSDIKVRGKHLGYAYYIPCFKKA